ncbi:SRPBCC family protein [Paenibacillus ferrarius]|uniref:SRPBCC family protein n=1 Tax=Paenibacillus ferrarius TaxID=1469647 RepID=UPI003D2BC4BE
METGKPAILKVEALIQSPIEHVWSYWTEPNHIIQWNSASPDWHTPRAENDLRVGGSFSSRMEAKDGSFGFDFGGVYDDVRPHEHIAYTIGDGRKVKIDFIREGSATRVVESFEAESQNAPEMQQAGWQAILDNFKKYAEKHE